MTTSGGGWTLAARVSSDFGWVCPERFGASCFNGSTAPGAAYSSPAPLSNANLFGQIHERSSVGLVNDQLMESGVHLPLAVCVCVCVCVCVFDFVVSVHSPSLSPLFHVSGYPGRDEQSEATALHVC